MNIVLITTGRRIDLLEQTLRSVRRNAVGAHHLTVVLDGASPALIGNLTSAADTLIVNRAPQGASAARNIGAASIPRYRRGGRVMFIDDDAYMCPEWDARIGETRENYVLSGHAHPFNRAIGQYHILGGGMVADAASVLSTVHLVMPWPIWDDVGEFVEPGGPGGSEDVEWCARATKKGYRLAVTHPHCVIHCGLTSSRGEPIVGYDLMVEQNKRVIAEYGLTGKVSYG